MPTSRISRAAVNARNQILTELKDDHKRVKKAYRQFQKLDSQKDQDACATIVEQVLDELTVHSAIEEELLYPMLRGTIANPGLIDEAEVEHEAMHTLMDQLRGMNPSDEKYAARFTVMCEYVLHHVKEEEHEVFPLLEKARLDWESMASDMARRRQELMPAAGAEDKAAPSHDSHAAHAAHAADDEGAGEDASAETPAGVADEDSPLLGTGNRGSARRASPGPGRPGPAGR